MTADLKRLAEAALPEARFGWLNESDLPEEIPEVRALVAACTPATILALCKRLEVAEHDLGVTKASLAAAFDVAEAAERKVEAWGPALEQLALAVDYGLLEHPLPPENSSRGNAVRIYLQEFRDAYDALPEKP